jgi:hypothetical protein
MQEVDKCFNIFLAIIIVEVNLLVGDMYNAGFSVGGVIE